MIETLDSSSVFRSFFLFFSYGNEYEPYARPDSHMGFVNGHGSDDYDHPIDEYGQPVDEYGRPLMLDEYEHYPQGYPQGYPYGGHHGQLVDDDGYDYGYR